MSSFFIMPGNLNLDLQKAINRINQDNKQKARQGKGKKMPVDTHATMKSQPKAAD